ncbi:hypothetical protein [[Mycobacterium] vasticus]|uniref:AMP-dependent synthetase/ligase domain-containing protein n=1 Tax=[Mycobacterium] vasticus TaxID=2875777 RepID=A0ABU5Z643_9MYCO|nr:hypothetical protein [Mycolicibacter sp. MYC017]MEB3071689.1 hypothetical protein [Mycolicibacter sp. MYC017]
MTYASALERSRSLPRPNPAMIGRFTVDGEDIDFPVSEADLDRDSLWWKEILRGYGVKAGDHVLISSHAWHCPWIDPIRTALTKLGAVHSNVEAWGWDAPRMASFLRRFPISLIVGLELESVLALENSEDLKVLLGDVTLLAQPKAVERLNECGFRAATILRIGPANAVAPAGESGTARLIIDNDEWLIQTQGNEFVVTSRSERSARFERQLTGVHGRTLHVEDRTYLELQA